MRQGAISELTPSIIRDLLDCDFSSGLLFWRARSPQIIPSEKGRKLWNARYAGKPAFTATHSQGYKYGNLLARPRFAHRIIWAHRYGEQPRLNIDHIDGDRTNNAIENLRCVSHTKNMRNMKMLESNKSGVVGVYWSKRRQKWVANISLNNRTVYLGIFDQISDAALARKKAELAHGFHENHGRAA